MTFRKYLKAAVRTALHDETAGTDRGELEWIHMLCRRGVRRNHARLKPATFLERYLWCVGSSNRNFDVRQGYWARQMALFRQCDARRIVGEAIIIREEWENSARYLNKSMVDSIMFAAALVAAEGWKVFKQKYLPLPQKPEAETAAAWEDAYWLLDQFPLVGEALAWYLIRNLYGAPFLKPDVHIRAIADHFFGSADSPVDALAAAVRQAWPGVCPDHRFQPVHLGEVDYILWWYRRSTRFWN